MQTLQDITGYESGVVIYDGDVLVLNWSTINGMPRVFATGYLGLGEDLSEAEQIGEEGMNQEEIDLALAAAQQEVEEQGGSDDLKISGAWRVRNALVVTFADWH